MKRLKLLALGLVALTLGIAVFGADLEPALNPVVPQVKAKKKEKARRGIPKKEGMSPGRYPTSVDDLLLHCDYKEANPGHLTDLTAYERSLNYPIFPADHVGTNNLRYWRKPTNGQCAPGELCGGFYQNTPQSIPKPTPPPITGHGKIRVNYYDANTSA